MINTLGYTNVITIIPFPRAVAQVVTMGALLIAFALALVLNPRIRIRPNAYLLLLSMVVLVSVMGSSRMISGYGSFLRCFRLIVFVATLWLVSGWWRGDLRFARYQLLTLASISLSVLVGLVISPGDAFSGSDGRLSGAIWPIPPTQVGQYAAVAAGLVAVMWLMRAVDGRSAAVIVVPSSGLLLLSHTRTALFGVVVSLLVCSVVMSLNEPRARRFLASAGLLIATVWVLFGGLITTWLARGQDTEQLSNFTGRAKVWDQLLAVDRSPADLAFGVGLTDKSFNGLPIDSAWLAVYQEQGWTGAILVACFLLVLLGKAILSPPSPQRSCALFLVVYCVSASYTEVGLGDASPYLLNLAVAASLLVGPWRNGQNADVDSSLRQRAAVQPL
jgi:hypothetical protein